MMQTEDRQIIGILVSDEELNNNSVFINRSSAIQYTLKSLSIPRGEPEYLLDILAHLKMKLSLKMTRISMIQTALRIFGNGLANNCLFFLTRQAETLRR